MTVDIARLRALREDEWKVQNPASEWTRAIHDYAPALFDELEALRAEVGRLTFERNAAREATTECRKQGEYQERAYTLAWLRNLLQPIIRTQDVVTALERGDHLAHEEPQP